MHLTGYGPAWSPPTKSALMEGAPAVWTDYVRGRTRRRQLWRTHVRTTEAQLPMPGSDNERVLEELANLPPKQFESVIVALFREMKTVEHSITQTRYVNDNGFDFFRYIYHASSCCVRSATAVVETLEARSWRWRGVETRS